MKRCAQVSYFFFFSLSQCTADIVCESCSHFDALPRTSFDYMYHQARSGTVRSFSWCTTTAAGSSTTSRHPLAFRQIKLRAT